MPLETGAEWESVAPAWEEHRDFIFETTRAVSEQMLAALAPVAGEMVLELACGTGETGFQIAELIAPGVLVQSDLSPTMVAAAQRGARARGLSNVEHRVLDAQALDLPDASVDAIVCRFGFMLMPDQSAAFAEARRVLRPGGRLVFSVWGAPERNMWIAALALPLLQAGKFEAADPTQPGGIFSLASESAISDRIARFGYASVDVEEVPIITEVEDFAAWWNRQTAIAGPLAASFASLTHAERESMRESSRLLLEPMREGHRYRITSAALVATAIAGGPV